jgi:hypothetical protein
MWAREQVNRNYRASHVWRFEIGTGCSLNKTGVECTRYKQNECLARED